MPQGLSGKNKIFFLPVHTLHSLLNSIVFYYLAEAKYSFKKVAVRVPTVIYELDAGAYVERGFAD